jgi:hypothetical protein
MDAKALLATWIEAFNRHDADLPVWWCCAMQRLQSRPGN